MGFKRSPPLSHSSWPPEEGIQSKKGYRYVRTSKAEALFRINIRGRCFIFFFEMI